VCIWSDSAQSYAQRFIMSANSRLISRRRDCRRALADLSSAIVVLLGVVGAPVLLLRRTLGAKRTAASRQFFFARSYTSEDRVQRFSIIRPHCFNAIAHLSLSFAGGLCNGTIDARDQ